MGGKVPHNWKVEAWNARGGIDRLLADCARLDIGIAAFEAAVIALPAETITLRHGMQTLREHKAGEAHAYGPVPVRKIRQLE